MKNRNLRTEKLKVKITVCLLIAVAVLVIQKIDGHEENRVVSAVMDYYGRDYSVGEVAAAMSEGLERAEQIPSMLKNRKTSESESDVENGVGSDAKESANSGDGGEGDGKSDSGSQDGEASNSEGKAEPRSGTDAAPASEADMMTSIEGKEAGADDSDADNLKADDIKRDLSA